MNYYEICRKAVETYGIVSQEEMAREEMDELGVALSHFKRGRATAEDVITEIADVTIMMYQLATIFGIEKVTAEIDRKLERLEGRLAGHAE